VFSDFPAKYLPTYLPKVVINRDFQQQNHQNSIETSVVARVRKNSALTKNSFLCPALHRRFLIPILSYTCADVTLSDQLGGEGDNGCTGDSASGSEHTISMPGRHDQSCALARTQLGYCNGNVNVDLSVVT